MSNNPNPNTDSSQPKIYQIRIQGHLDGQWSDWFDGLKITQDDEGNSLLTGPVVDDAALYGLLKKVRDLGMSLISFNQIQPGQEEPEKNKNESGNSSANAYW